MIGSSNNGTGYKGGGAAVAANGVRQATPVESPTGRPGAAPSLSELLIDLRGLSIEEIGRARDHALQEHLPLGQVLVRDGLILSRDLAVFIALNFGLTMVDLSSQTLEPEVVGRISKRVARRYLALPLKFSDGRLTVAMVDPTDVDALHDLYVRTGCEIDPVVATSDDVLDHLDIAYRITDEAVQDASATQRLSGGRVTVQHLRDAPPSEVVDLLLRQALQDRASDVHMEPGESRLRLRFRIDGILHDVMQLPLSMHPALISRLKIMSGMNIAERRRPQDGQFVVEIDGRKVDVRAAISSTVNGEIAVLRLLDKDFTLLGLEQLGMSAVCLEQYRQLIRLPFGMIIVCGPTGAGKSTTLYASLLQMDRTERNVISIEDPVEYRIANVNQMQVNPGAQVTFASQLRSILRLDPDVVLVGEIRDQETATVAIQAALTGHLVFSSLHANDGVSALLRLRDLGVPPYLIASSVVGIVAQRMVRVVCHKCRTLMAGSVADQEAYASEMGEERSHFYYGSGCNMCAQTGYRGRSGVFEVLSMSDSMRHLFLNEEPKDRLLTRAIDDGMVPCRRDGMLKVRDGATTPHEVTRVLFNLD